MTKKYQIKIFGTANLDELEDVINEWLNSLKPSDEIIRFQQSESDGPTGFGVTVIFLYTTEVE